MCLISNSSLLRWTGISAAWERFVDPKGWEEALHFSPLPLVRSVLETVIQHLNFSQLAGRDCISSAPSSDGLPSFASCHASLYFSFLGQEGGGAAETDFL